MNKLAMGLVILSIIYGCKTTSYVANVDEKKEKFEVQSQSDPGSTIHSLQKKGILDSLALDLKEKLKSNDKDTSLLLNLSQIYLSRGDLENAEEFCRKALKYELKSKEAKLILAQIYFRRGFVAMTEIILNGLGSEVDKDSLALNLKALVALKNDRPSYAMNFFKESLKYNPNDIATRMNLGVLHVHYRQIDSAAIQFERILKIMPNNTDAKMHLAVIKASRGEFETAEGLYKDVLSIDSKNALAVYNLAVLEEKRKNYDDSLDHIKSYLGSSYAKSQDNKDVFAMIERLKSKKDMIGEKVSDSEIQEISSQLKSPVDDSNNSGVIPLKKELPTKTVDSTPTKKKVDTPKATEKEKSYKNDEDEIESLEKALNQ